MSPAADALQVLDLAAYQERVRTDARYDTDDAALLASYAAQEEADYAAQALLADDGGVS